MTSAMNSALFCVCVLCLLCFYFLLSPSSFLLHFFCCFRPISLAIKYTYMYVFFSFNIFLRSFALFLTTFQLDLLGTFIILLFHNSDVAVCSFLAAFVYIFHMSFFIHFDLFYVIFFFICFFSLFLRSWAHFRNNILLLDNIYTRFCQSFFVNLFENHCAWALANFCKRCMCDDYGHKHICTHTHRLNRKEAKLKQESVSCLI